jgi:hypothetical protein|tara:strand:- start:1630 stop:1821 length:192 start_codon:yes stop_codon:yes gene_type:complete
MSRKIEIIIEDNGNITIEGYELKPGETIAEVAKFLTDQIAEVTELGHKHKHNVIEKNKLTQSQ